MKNFFFFFAGFLEIRAVKKINVAIFFNINELCSTVRKNKHTLMKILIIIFN